MAYAFSGAPSKVTAQVRASLLGRAHALRVIGAGESSYVDFDNNAVSYNVLSATAQAQIIGLGLITDFKCMSESLGERADSVTVADVRDNFKDMYKQWKEQVRLENTVNGDDLKSTFDKYVAAFKVHATEAGDAIEEMITKPTSFLQGNQIPNVPDYSKAKYQKTETVSEVQPDGSVQTKQVGLVDRFGKPVMVYPARKLWTTDVPLSEQSAIMAAARFTEISASLVIALKASVKGVMIKVD